MWSLFLFDVSLKEPCVWNINIWLNHPTWIYFNVEIYADRWTYSSHPLMHWFALKDIFILFNSCDFFHKYYKKIHLNHHCRQQAESCKCLQSKKTIQHCVADWMLIKITSCRRGCFPNLWVGCWRRASLVETVAVLSSILGSCCKIVLIK